MTRSRSRMTQEWIAQTVHIKNPPITSLANLVLLSRQYFALDDSIYTERRMSRIREKWMKEQIKIYDGKLTCGICNRKGLINNTTHTIKRATLDHIVEISDGGSWNDPRNFRIACYFCNTRRNRKSQISI